MEWAWRPWWTVEPTTHNSHNSDNSHNSIMAESCAAGTHACKIQQWSHIGECVLPRTQDCHLAGIAAGNCLEKEAIFDRNVALSARLKRLDNPIWAGQTWGRGYRTSFSFQSHSNQTCSYSSYAWGVAFFCKTSCTSPQAKWVVLNASECSSGCCDYKSHLPLKPVKGIANFAVPAISCSTRNVYRGAARCYLKPAWL